MTTADMLADELVEVITDEDPLLASMFGIRDADSAMPDLSVGACDAVRARASDIVTRARALDDAALPAVDRVTKAMVEQQAEAVCHRIDSRAAEYTVTDFFVAPAARAMYFLPRVTVTDTAQAEAYLARLAKFRGYLSTAAQRHVDGTDAGRPPVARLVDSATTQLDRALALGADDPLLHPLRQDGLETYAEQGRRLLESEIRPAMASYRAVIGKIALHARPDERPGLCWIADGEPIYASLIRVHTDAHRSTEDLHQTGREHVANLHAEIARSGEKLFGTSDVAEIFHRLRFDQRLRWHDGEEMLEAARVAVAKAEVEAPKWFAVVPEQRCVVEAVPPAQDAAIPSGTYLMPSPEGQRPGTFFTNITRPTERFRYSCETVAFHEGVPGHHFQVTRAQGLSHLPMLRRLPLSTAYVEGWALYTERLADEMGLYSDELSRMGMLVADVLRAVRLVVDTGLHAKGWSRSAAIDYVRANTVLPDVEVEAEVNRFIGLPGQALAYMVGRLEISRIRAAAEAALGDRFDIRTFHDTVLNGGTLPLAVLADVVDDWTKSLLEQR
ncbi:DUF885 domain-containing protein [Kibdelosporangium persicum]|uniref:DUF885 domain-containing protein n=1 Tax=Kibdelosporangium persicum TaxID=2698649 RepID=A0ABX2F1L1_9PSEU|nr:DUF885 domain-containing protein [Kibdelosporangium persicum]NRN65201.1 DUF885 domain-containing protein [Kibdelosporangium persicum]